jgi:hypothetical protein
MFYPFSSNGPLRIQTFYKVFFLHPKITFAVTIRKNHYVLVGAIEAPLYAPKPP